MKKTSPRALPLILCAAFANLLIAQPTARAGYVVELDQVGSNVVATGYGSIDLSGLTFYNTFSSGADIFPPAGIILTGPLTGVVDEYHIDSVSGSLVFGNGALASPNSGTGDLAGFDSSTLNVFVRNGYVAGKDPLADTSTYNNQTFSSLGVTPGTYEVTWGNGPDQNFTVQVGPATVPEPSSLALLAIAAIALFGLRRFGASLSA